MSPTAELTRAGRHQAERPVAVPPVSDLRSRSLRRRRRRQGVMGVAAALVVGVVAGGALALDASDGDTLAVATATSDGVASQPSTIPTPTTVPTTVPQATSRQATGPPATVAPTTETPTTLPTTVLPEAAGSVDSFTLVDGAAAAELADRAASRADLTFEYEGTTVWLRLEDDLLAASAHDGERFVSVEGTVGEAVLYLLFAQFELPFGLDAPLEVFLVEEILPSLGDQAPTRKELDRMLEEWMHDLELRPTAAEVQRFLTELWEQVPDLRLFFGDVPDLDQLGDQLDQLGSMFGSLERLPESARPGLGEMRRDLQRRLDELDLPDVDVPGSQDLLDQLDDLRNRWFGGDDEERRDREEESNRDEPRDRGNNGNTGNRDDGDDEDDEDGDD